MSDATQPAPPMLRTETTMADPDGFYEALIALHRDLDEARSALVNAKLVLLLANHIGDEGVLAEAMRRAREGVGPSALADAPSGTVGGSAEDAADAEP
jgi:hypothetical protein